MDTRLNTNIYLVENLLHLALSFWVTHISIFVNMLRNHGLWQKGDEWILSPWKQKHFSSAPKMLSIRDQRGEKYVCIINFTLCHDFQRLFPLGFSETEILYHSKIFYRQWGCSVLMQWSKGTFLLAIPMLQWEFYFLTCCCIG